MTKYIYCPECAEKLTSDNKGLPTCQKGHFTKYTTPVASTLAFIYNDGKYLVIRRSRQPQKGSWDLPGGFGEPGETAYQTLLREIDEETQLKNLELVKFLGTFPSNYGGTEDTLAAGYLFDSADREVVLSEENDEHMWVALDNFPNLAFKDCRDALVQLKENLVSVR